MEQRRSTTSFNSKRQKRSIHIRVIGVAKGVNVLITINVNVKDARDILISPWRIWIYLITYRFEIIIKVDSLCNFSILKRLRQHKILSCRCIINQEKTYYYYEFDVNSPYLDRLTEMLTICE